MDDITDEFFEDYENEQNNPGLRDFMQFITDLSYEGKDINPESFNIKYKKPLRASKFIRRNGNELF